MEDEMRLLNGYKKYAFTWVCTGKFVPQIEKTQVTATI